MKYPFFVVDHAVRKYISTNSNPIQEDSMNKDRRKTKEGPEESNSVEKLFL
jgi:hypothetical protein